MSGVLRRGSLNFNCNLNAKNTRGHIDSNLYGGYRDSKPRTPEISVIALDFRRYSDDLKKDNAFRVDQQQGQKDKKRELSEDVDSDEISNYIGHYGKWQFVWTFILSLFQLPPTFHMFAFVFQTAEKDFWCARPATLPNVSTTDWRNQTQENGACSILDMDFSSFFDLGDIFQQSLSARNYTACKEFEFAGSDGDGKTLVEEFSLVCDRAKLLSVVEMCFLAGAAVGSVSSGWISDRFGRKITLMGFAFVQALFGTILAFSTSLAMYMTLRVIIGFASMTVTVVSFVLVVELVSGKWRTIIGILNILPVAVTYVLTAGLAYLIRDWRWFQLVVSMPGAILLSIWYCVPESPRWLLARGRLSELYAIIERAAKTNGIVLPANYKKSLEAVASTESPTPKPHPVSLEAANGENPSIKDDAAALPTQSLPRTSDIDCNSNPLKVVFSSTYWRTTCLTLVVWLTLIIIYFGLTLHLSNLGGNIYLNNAIAGTVEAISICLSIIVVLKLGIRRNLIAYMLIPGVCCLATNLVPAGDGNQMGVIALAMIAKCFIGANNAIIPTYTAMQYPTVVRNFGVGMGNLAAGVGLILVPYMWLLEHYDPLLPMSVMGVSGLIGAVALVLMKDIQN